MMLGNNALVPSLGEGLAPVGRNPSASAFGSAQATGGAGEDFATTLAGMVRDAAQTVTRGEAVALAGIDGKASAQQVVEAVMQAEQTLSAMVAVRDKVVGAYLEISRMQI